MHGHQNLRGEQGRARACSAGPKSEETGNQGESELRNQVMGKTKCVREGGQRQAKAVSDGGGQSVLGRRSHQASVAGI